MLARHNDIVIPPMDPYRNDKLHRKQYGSVLEQIVSTYNDGCVISLDGEWGTGKTTFVKMWKQQLDDTHYKTIYFNAWETDYIEDPLIALIAEFKRLSTNELQEITNNMVKTFSKMSLAMVPTILSLIAKYSFGVDIEKISKEGLEVLSNTLEQSIDKYVEQKKSIEAFQKALTEYVLEITSNKPLIFIVDELDRCNPKYAVKVLERIKHLFSVRNVVFVLSIDKKHLCHSVCGFYGNENIDAENYLRRFIDIEFSLPQPNAESFCNYLYDYYEFDDFFKNQERLDYFRNRDEATSFKKMARELMSYLNLPLRTVDRIFSNTRLALRMFSYSNYVHEKMLFILVYLRICKSSVYIRMCQHDYTLQEFVNEIEALFPKEMLRYDFETHSFYYVLALLMLCYNLDENEHEIEKLCEVENRKITRLCISFQYVDEEQIKIAIENWRKEFNGGAIGMKFFFEKIDLLSTLRS